MMRLAPLLLLTSLAAAAPRVGTHDGYTRLAFDLPTNATPQVTTTSTGVTITLNTALPAENGAVKSADVTAFRVTPSGKTTRLDLTVTSGRKSRVFVLPAQGSTPARLVVDVGTKVEGVGVAPTANNQGVISRASTRTPDRVPVRVVLDAGHGGVDPGMVGFVVEKEINLAVALKVRARLEGRGVEVVLTRDRDVHLSSDKTTDLMRRAEMANAGTVNAFVSIHVNAATNATAQGIETWIFGQPIDAKTRALAVRENGGGDLGERLTREASNVAQGLLGDLLSQSNVTYSRKLAQLVQGKLIGTTGAVNRGIGTAPFAVIRYPRTPAILIELGFGSHPDEGRKLGTAAYQDKLADAIADAICDFLNVPYT